MINNLNIILLIIIIVLLIFVQNNIECFETDDDNQLVPKVEFPFKNILDDNYKRLNIILISAPFREQKHEDLYLKYKEMGLYFCGISSYLEFPGKIVNPYEDRFHEEKGHDYVNMVDAWIYCFRNLTDLLKNSGLPLLFMSEADLKNTDHYPYDETIQKEYDFIYICLDDNDKCDPGWQSYNRSWELAKKCLEIMCGDYNLKGLIVGRTNCDLPIKCENNIKRVSFLPFFEFQNEIKKARFIFIPNISDASPRVITEALCYNVPALVNYNIFGGWHNIISGETGELFNDETDLSLALDKIISDKYNPREWYVRNKGYKNSSAIFATFLVENFPNINNKDVRYISIP
jgi:hypothetical protein